MKNKRVFLFSGLLLLLVSFVIKAISGTSFLFWGVLVLGISGKSFFLYQSAKDGSIKWGKGIVLILSGVGLAIVSVILKRFGELLLISRIILGIAVLFKISGIVSLLFERQKVTRKK
jgi:hypothetical protein